MATLVGAVFDEYSEIGRAYNEVAVDYIGPYVGFSHTSGPTLDLQSTNQNDLYFVNDSRSDTDEMPNGGIDLVVSSVSYTLGGNVEHMILTGKKDLTGIGNSLNNVIAGNDGDNMLEGNAGNDMLFGGPGRDTLSGGTGQDSLYGGGGNDLLSGGEGDDRLDGDKGQDLLLGGKGHDTLYGGDAADDLSGNTGDDWLYGQDGHDVISGNHGQDMLFGGEGKDTLIGGEGDDVLSGGDEKDTFFFDGVVGDDTIVDFGKGDRIRITSKTTDSASVRDLLNNHVSMNSLGDAVIDLGRGHTITLKGIDPDDLNSDDFIIV